MSSIDKARAKLRKWRDNPASMVREEFGVEPDAWQLDFLNAFPDQRRLALKACKGPGKTAALAWVGWNFIATRKHPKIAVTSITKDNLRDNLWAELAKWRNRSEFLKQQFEWTKTRIYARDFPDTWWMSARTWSRQADSSQQEETLAGLHADYLLFLIDESSGIPDSVMATAEAGLATGIETKLVQAGNPTQVSGPLYRACTDEANLWWVKEITGDPEDPDRSPRVSIEWAKEQIEKYGKDNPWVLVNVFGQFPPSGINTLLGPEDVREAIGRHHDVTEYEFAAKVLGLDMARFGDDRIVGVRRQGVASFQPWIMRNERTENVAARAANDHRKHDLDAIVVDGTGGYGGGVVDALRLLGCPVFEIHMNSRAREPERFYNIRSESWFRMAEWVKGSGALYDSDDYRRELVGPTYSFQNGRLRVEEKDQIKDRIGNSPDVGDALVLTFCVDVAPRPAPDRLLSPMQRVAAYNERSLTEWDPMDLDRLTDGL